MDSTKTNTKSSPPRKGDEYLSPVYGITVMVDSIKKRNGERWVVFRASNGWRCRARYDDVVRRWRRARPRGAPHTRRARR